MKNDRTVTDRFPETYLGSYTDEHGLYRVNVEVRLEQHHGTSITVDHAEITGYQRLSITGSLSERLNGSKRWNRAGGGQIADELRKITDFDARGWDPAKVARLADIWDEWHLNDMRAACAHQPPESIVWENKPYPRPDVQRTPACPVTGYRYGTAWLVKPLPVQIAAEVRQLCWGTT